MSHYDVSSWFVEQAQARSSEPVRKLLIGNSDYSTRVLKWPTIKRDAEELKPQSITLELADEDSLFNFFRDNKLTLLNSVQVQFGFTHPSSGDELITVFSGTTRKAKWDRGSVKLTLIDHMKPFLERTVGDAGEIISYTGSNHLASDILWYLVTSYGGLSSVKSDSNPDIHFDTWAAVHSQYVDNNVFIQAEFAGQKVSEALRKVARMTDTLVYEENNKLVFQSWTDPTSIAVALDDDSISRSSLEVDDQSIFNKQFIYAGYSTAADSFSIVVHASDSGSVNSYGIRERIEKDVNVWHVNSSTAINLAQRKVLFAREPFEFYDIQSTLVPIHRQLGETVYFADAQLEVSSGTPWRITGYEFNMDTGAVRLSLDGSQVQFGFTLDVDTYSALDEDYNPLL